MRNFLLDTNPKFGETIVRLKDNNGKESVYTLRRVKNNGCVLTVLENGIERDQVVFTMQDLRAVFLLITTNEVKK